MVYRLMSNHGYEGKEVCATCRWADDLTVEDTLYCNYNPPTVVYSHDMKQLRTTHPVVQLDYFCHCWEARP